jgi:heme-degrading monooxygenase HmoA
MLHQFRAYEIFEDTKPAFLARFRDHAAPIMRRHGFQILGMWEAQRPDRLEFTYLLAWADEQAMKAGWAAFMADQEWTDVKRVTAAEHGKLVGAIEDRVMRLTDFSPKL